MVDLQRVLLVLVAVKDKVHCPKFLVSCLVKLTFFSFPFPFFLEGGGPIAPFIGNLDTMYIATKRLLFLGQRISTYTHKRTLHTHFHLCSWMKNYCQ